MFWSILEFIVSIHTVKKSEKGKIYGLKRELAKWAQVMSLQNIYSLVQI